MRNMDELLRARGSLIQYVKFNGDLRDRGELVTLTWDPITKFNNQKEIVKYLDVGSIFMIVDVVPHDNNFYCVILLGAQLLRMSMNYYGKSDLHTFKKIS